MYYTYYVQYSKVSTAPLPSNFRIMYCSGIEKNCDGQFISPDARYVLEYKGPAKQRGGVYPGQKKGPSM